MRKNILGAVVFSFVTLAFLLMLNDITDDSYLKEQNTVEVNEADKEIKNDSDLATIEIEEE